jgi:hypothetical protein
MNKSTTNNSAELSQEIINLVVARLKTVPSNANLSVGGNKEPMAAEDLIKEVKEQTEIGKKIIESQLYFLTSSFSEAESLGYF